MDNNSKVFYVFQQLNNVGINISPKKILTLFSLCIILCYSTKLNNPLFLQSRCNLEVERKFRTGCLTYINVHNVQNHNLKIRP